MYLGDEELTVRPEDELDDHIRENTDPTITAAHTHATMPNIEGVAPEPIADINMENTAAAAAAIRKMETVGSVCSMMKQNAVK